MVRFKLKELINSQDNALVGIDQIAHVAARVVNFTTESLHSGDLGDFEHSTIALDGRKLIALLTQYHQNPCLIEMLEQYFHEESIFCAYQLQVLEHLRYLSSKLSQDLLGFILDIEQGIYDLDGCGKNTKEGKLCLSLCNNTFLNDNVRSDLRLALSRVL